MRDPYEVRVILEVRRFFLILLAVSIVGLGSSVFHPTASRVAQMASGGKKSLAQSIFQVGGNGGSAVGTMKEGEKNRHIGNKPNTKLPATSMREGRE